MTTWLQQLVEPGPASTWRRAARVLARACLKARARTAAAYVPPDDAALAQIELELVSAGIVAESLHVDAREFAAFQRAFPFPEDYYGAAEAKVHIEKLLEHYIAWHLIRPDATGRQPYVDVAACASPWAMLLRKAAIEAFSIDLAPTGPYADLPYYECQDATRTRFSDASIGSASLQCAFEMFIGDQDTGLIRELSRTLRAGGRAVIVPLYMHTHACYYQTPEYLGRVFGDSGATAYVRRDCWGIASSRKYSSATLIQRVWRPALDAGLVPSLRIVRNAREIYPLAYVYFILILDKPATPTEAS